MMRKSYILAGLLVFANCLWHPGCTGPQSAKAELPSGESLMDKFVEAAGGAEAHKKIKNSAARGTLEVSGMGVKFGGSFAIWEAEPNLRYMVREIAQIGEFLEGCDGKAAWSYDGESPTIARGKILEEALLQAQCNQADWRARYTRAETKSIDNVEGEECYRVIATTKAGYSETHHYSKQTSLLVKTVRVDPTSSGGGRIESVNKDYRMVNGILVPHQIIQRAEGMSVVMTFSEIKKNTDLPQSVFEPPPRVKARLK
jgi:outer membrane lipoprotein-sorting protein